MDLFTPALVMSEEPPTSEGLEHVSSTFETSDALFFSDDIYNTAELEENSGAFQHLQHDWDPLSSSTFGSQTFSSTANDVGDWDPDSFPDATFGNAFLGS